jgi:undecaprenyl-diphosphatase
MGELILRLRRGDERALIYVIGRRRAGLDRAFRRLTHLGDAAVTIGVVTLLLLSPVPGWQAAGGVAAFALIVSHLAVQIIKRSVSRARPRLPVGVQSLIEPPDRFSFPSGHAAAALSVALGLATVVTGPLALLLLGLAGLVGVSRCYLGVHYPGDVLFGWLLAGAAFGMSGILL